MLLYPFSYSSSPPLPLYPLQKMSLTPNEPKKKLLRYILGAFKSIALKLFQTSPICPSYRNLQIYMRMRMERW